MGKEAKIGLAFLAVLLITFGVVLARRLCSPGETPPATASAKKSNEKGKPAKDEVTSSEDFNKGSRSGSASRPTVVKAKPASTKRSPASKWTVVSDAKPAKQRTSPAVQSGPPSFFPSPPKPSSGTGYDLYAGRTRQSAQQPWQTNRAGSATVQAAPQPSPVRVLSPPSRQSAQYGRSGLGNAAARQYSPAGYRNARVPGYQQRPPAYSSTPYPATRTQQRAISGLGVQATRDADGRYEIAPNDSYWTISEKLYGSGAYFKALAEHNREKFPQENQLAVGEKIAAPSIEELEKTYPGLCPSPERRETVRSRASLASTRHSHYGGGRTYKVEEGDTLFDIARYELGKASRWVEIHELNRDALGKDFDYLTPGMELVLPSNRKPEIVTERPGTTRMY